MIRQDDLGRSGSWASTVLSIMLAYFSVCPVLVNLMATFVADGNSFVFTVALSCIALVLTVSAGTWLGFPWYTLFQSRGPTLLFVVIVGIFWIHWICLNLISPSPVALLNNLVIEALIWTIIPIVCFLWWRESISTISAIRVMIVLCAIFTIGLTVRWTMHMGIYQSGRWHAGLSLEAVRSGRYAGLSLWIFATACLCPKGIISWRYKVLCLICIPLTVLMMIATNSRGPWLGLTLTILVLSVPLCRLVFSMIKRDVRLLLVLVLIAISIGGYLSWKMSDVESDSSRLLTLNNDGGSARERLALWQDHLSLVEQTPATLVSGNGYDHGLFYPHNIFIEAMVDGGLVSLILLSGMVGLGIYVYIKLAAYDDVPSLIFFGIFLYDLIGSQVASSIAADPTWFGALLLVCRLEELIKAAPQPEIPCFASL